MALPLSRKKTVFFNKKRNMRGIGAFVLKFAIWGQYSGFVEHTVYSPPSGDIASDGDRKFLWLRLFFLGTITNHGIFILVIPASRTSSLGVYRARIECLRMPNWGTAPGPPLGKKHGANRMPPPFGWKWREKGTNLLIRARIEIHHWGPKKKSVPPVVQGGPW